MTAEPPSVEERVARHMAAEDWLTDPTDDAWWNSRAPKFRGDYLASARRVIAIVHGADQASPAVVAVCKCPAGDHCNHHSPAEPVGEQPTTKEN